MPQVGGICACACNIADIRPCAFRSSPNQHSHKDSRSGHGDTDEVIESKHRILLRGTGSKVFCSLEDQRHFILIGIRFIRSFFPPRLPLLHIVATAERQEQGDARARRQQEPEL